MAVSIYEALHIIETNLPAIFTEIIPIENALNRVSAQARLATIALPAFNNSAMDGYGLKGQTDTYTIIGKILAGDSHTYTLQEGECIKILTGAEVPASVESIIPQENTLEHKTSITIKKPVNFGANIRYRGEDIQENEMILDEGDTINSAHIGLLASQGITHIEVYRQLTVGVFASGSELKMHYETLGKSQIYNSNTYYLIARAKELHCHTRFVGKSEDNVNSLKKLVQSALNCDIIITSGGVSVGEADFTKAAFSELGMKTFFNKVNIKPGKPTTFGKIGNTLILNLPGNPLASALNFEIFGKFIIAKLSGQKRSYHHFIQTTITQEISSTRPTPNIIPGYYNGKQFTPVDKFAPGMVNVLNHCNGIIIIDTDTTLLKEGDTVKFLPIDWSFMGKEFEEFMS